MQIVTILSTLALAATALAVCPNGPYLQGSACGDGSDCAGALRCSKNAAGQKTHHVVRTAPSVFCSLPLTGLRSLIPSLPLSFAYHLPLLHSPCPLRRRPFSDRRMRMKRTSNARRDTCGV